MLSDVGANTLLLHPDTFVRSVALPNRLHAIRDYVAAGGVKRFAIANPSPAPPAVRVLELSNFPRSAAGSFIPMVLAICEEARGRGHEPEAVFLEDRHLPERLQRAIVGFALIALSRRRVL